MECLNEYCKEKQKLITEPEQSWVKRYQDQKETMAKTGFFYTFWNLPFKLKKFMVTGIGMTTLDVFTDLVQAINHFL